jgi:hypothetical protein
MKIIALCLLIAFALLVATALRFSPQESDFKKTNEIRGQMTYQGRYGSARINLQTVFSGGSFLGGSNTGFAQLPNGTEVVAQVAKIRSLTGEILVIVRATSIDGQHTYIEQSAAECVAAWRTATFMALLVAFLTVAGACIAVRLFIKG